MELILECSKRNVCGQGGHLWGSGVVNMRVNNLIICLFEFQNLVVKIQQRNFEQHLHSNFQAQRAFEMIFDFCQIQVETQDLKKIFKI